MFDGQIYVFVYDFPHRKSEAILLEFLRQEIEIAGVLAAPRVELKKYADWRGYVDLPGPAPAHPKTLADALGVPYHVVSHSDTAAIRSIVNSDALGIIGGARIIPSDVIEIFKFGIINYHPGKIPETSGLDSFYWMLAKRAPAMVTTHFIDSRVDAGRIIGYESIELVKEDTPATVAYKIFCSEMSAHSKILRSIKEGSAIESFPASRPSKNEPMTNEERRNAMNEFRAWLGSQL